MNSLSKFIIMSLLTFVTGYAHAAGIEPNSPKPEDNDSTTSLKSNIFIFKMMTSSPSTNSSASGTGSLKKAGKVARTSYSHSSIESIINKKKGI